ncbi:MAG TPA: TonB family protein [Rhizomicrobium sp.]|jgi:TonB family protein|nr:TonB family protein [Rhizomicrobium sp.]
MAARHVLFAMALLAPAGSARADDAAPPAPLKLGPPATGFASADAALWTPYIVLACKPGKPPAERPTWDGVCRDGKPDGAGTLVARLSGDSIRTFRGTFANGMLQGPVHIEDNSYDVPPMIAGTSTPARPPNPVVLLDSFDGMFVDGAPNGHGVWVYANGWRIEGTFKNDVLDGKVMVDHPDRSHDEYVQKDGAIDGVMVTRFAGGARQDVTYRDGVPESSLTVFPDKSTLAVHHANGGLDDAVFTGAHGEHYAGAFVSARTDPAVRLPPMYPDLSRKLNETGQVGVRYLVGADGSLADVGLYVTSGHERLDDAALATVNASRHLPATVDGHPIPMIATVVHRFNLVSGKAPK